MSVIKFRSGRNKDTGEWYACYPSGDGFHIGKRKKTREWVKKLNACKTDKEQGKVFTNMVIGSIGESMGRKTPYMDVLDPNFKMTEEMKKEILDMGFKV